MLNKLHIKILLAMLAVILFSEVVIVEIFTFVVDTQPSHLRGELTVAAHFVEKALQEKGEDVESILQLLDTNYNADFWITRNGVHFAGKHPVTSLPPILSVTEVSFQRSGDSDDYGTIPLYLADNTQGLLHVLYRSSHVREGNRLFFQGMIHVALALALLGVPLSRAITRPLRQLNSTVVFFSKGNFFTRAKETGNDEIGELARSFNIMAERLERMITGGKELTANISHELRTPLARIRILSELLQESGEIKQAIQASPKIAGHFASVHEEIGIMDTLIGKILQLSRFELQQEAPLRGKPVPLVALLEKVFSRHAEKIAEKTIKIVKHRESEMLVLGSEEVLSEALENIISNAVKFSPERKEIVVSVQEERGEKRGVLVSVSNISPTLDAAELEKIFTPFYRTQEQVDGFGLGLAIARRGIERHRGQLTAHSDEDTFTIELRLPLLAKEPLFS